MTHPDLANVLALAHAHLVEDRKQAASLIEAQRALEESDKEDILSQFVSERGLVEAWRTPAGECVLCVTDIQVVGGGYRMDAAKVPAVFRFDTADEAEIRADSQRAFLAHSIDSGATRRFAGWRDRVVALIPEEVGLKEANIFRTRSDGSIQRTHTYNALDAVTQYAKWVGELADEFGSTDEKYVAGIETPNVSGLYTPQVVQAWLVREAAEAELAQARTSLKGYLAIPSHLLGMSVAELARSLHTDRPNLSRVIKAAAADPELRGLIASLTALG